LYKVEAKLPVSEKTPLNDFPGSTQSMLTAVELPEKSGGSPVGDPDARILTIIVIYRVLTHFQLFNPDEGFIASFQRSGVFWPGVHISPVAESTVFAKPRLAEKNNAQKKNNKKIVLTFFNNIF